MRRRCTRRGKMRFLNLFIGVTIGWWCNRVEMWFYIVAPSPNSLFGEFGHPSSFPLSLINSFSVEPNLCKSLYLLPKFSLNLFLFKEEKRMNKGGGVGVGGGGGPTAAASAAAAQKQKNLLQRVDNDIANIVDNFSYLVNVARVNDPPVRNSQEAFMMEMRAARTVQAADSLLKLVSELKQTAIFSGFSSLSEHVEQRTNEFNQQAEKTDCMLSRIGEEAAGSLKELETHYYSSCQKTNNIEPR